MPCDLNLISVIEPEPVSGDELHTCELMLAEPRASVQENEYGGI